MTYNSKIMKHVDNPSNLGALDTKAKDVGTGFVGNAACGDMLKIQIKVVDGIIEDVKAKIFGCGCAIASTSLATEKLKGRTLSEAQKLTDHEIAEELGLPAIKLHCSVLAAKGVLRAIKNYEEKQNNCDIELKLDEHTSCCNNTQATKSNANESQSSCCAKMHQSDTKSCAEDSEHDHVSSVDACCKNNANKAQQSQTDEHHVHTQNQQHYTLEQPFMLTPAAFERFWHILSTDLKAIGIRIFSKAGGCAGNEYDVALQYPDQSTANISNSLIKYAYRMQTDSFVRQIIFFIPKDSLMFLLGLDIDYKVTDVSAQFIFTNKNFRTCGCGSSFTS